MTINGPSRVQLKYEMHSYNKRSVKTTEVAK